MHLPGHATPEGMVALLAIYMITPAPGPQTSLTCSIAGPVSPE
jgi:hypothetical protein